MKVESDRWGIIYVPRAGERNAQKRWRQIREYLDMRKVKYDCVQSEGADTIERITGMLISNGYRRIVVIGGDEALNGAINGIMFTPREIRSEITLGIVPNGIGNDFASFWGLTVDGYKQAIHWIIEGRTKKIDVGYCSYREGDDERVRYFLMSVNIGLSAQAIRLSDICKRFGRKNPSYLLALISLFKERKLYKMRLKVNNDDINDRIMTMCIGNSRGYGLTPSAVPYNGWIDLSIIARPKFLQLIKGLYMLLHGQILNHEQVRPFRTKSVTILDAGGASTCLDGKSITPNYPMTVSLEPGALNFIIPG
ncbi:MAG: lipid kinase [Bacteroidaceae bacterium]|nr:lipid kinase [Bacteroidaceae bacterium]